MRISVKEALVPCGENEYVPRLMRPHALMFVLMLMLMAQGIAMTPVLLSDGSAAMTAAAVSSDVARSPSTWKGIIDWFASQDGAPLIFGGLALALALIAFVAFAVRIQLQSSLVIATGLLAGIALLFAVVDAQVLPPYHSTALASAHYEASATAPAGTTDLPAVRESGSVWGI